MSQSLLEKSNYYLQNQSSLKKEDISGLQEIIREHNKLYYNEESPVISDKEYDELFKILKSLEEKFNISNYNSPTQKIDVLLSKQFEKGKHKTPMLSLDNTYNSEDIHEFDKRILNILKNDEKLSYIIELKFDGLGISLTYKNGKLIRALTRGKGDEGEDVTINIMQISNIPKKIPFTHNEEIEIRGEIVMPIYEFEKLNKSRLDLGEKLFANPRNAASGSVRQLDYNITKSRNLKFFAYNFPYLENNFLEENILTYSEILDKLKSFGFSTSPYFFKARNIDEVIKEIEKVGTNKVNYEFETDGLVIKLDDLKKWKSLGFTEHHPRYSIAYKFPATNVRTKILDIEHSVGRTGILTPVAHLNPVNVSGVIVKRATLHNYDELQKKEIKLGDEVFIVRAGEVIPEVVSVIKEVRTGKEKEVIIPEFCPSCETRLKKDEGKVAWYCPNKKFCPAQTLGSLISFVSRSGANIEGLGDKIIELFIEKEFITDFVSIYHLKKFQNEILALEGFKDKKVSNILEEIENSRKMPLTNFLVALGIPQVGKKTAKLLANKISSKLENDKNSNLSEILFNLNSEELEEIKDIGPIGAHNVVYYFEEYSDLVSRLLNEINIILPEISNQTSSLPLNGKSFCVTGSFPDISRDEIHKIIEENGGETRTSVTKNLDYLVVGSEAGSKLAKAKEFNVQILSLEEFYKLIQK